jgi:hypothetical protein
MKRQNQFNTLTFNFIYSNGLVYEQKKQHNYFFSFAVDAFNTEIWLKKKKNFLENKQLLKFKHKFAQKKFLK